MEPVYRIQVIKAGILPVQAVAVFNSTIRYPRECTIASQPVAEGERPVCDMPFKYPDELFCAGFCPIVDGGKGIPFALDARTDVDVLIGNTLFSVFAPCLRGIRLNVSSNLRPL